LEIQEVDKNLLELHEIINILESNGHYVQANELNDMFLKLAQKKKYDIMPFPSHLSGKGLDAFADYVKVSRDVIRELNPDVRPQVGVMIAVPVGTKDPSKVAPKKPKTLKEVMEEQKRNKKK
jgi:hypothetical protein